MRIATLAIVLDAAGNVLLGQKKNGEIGYGLLCGPGGKLEEGETYEECVIRETREEMEVELDPSSLELVAVIDFYVASEIDFRVYIYRARIASGEAKETDDMIPEWHPLNDLPFGRMYEADMYWFLKAAHGDKFRANVFYRERAKDLINIDFLPFEEVA